MVGTDKHAPSEHPLGQVVATEFTEESVQKDQKHKMSPQELNQVIEETEEHDYSED